MLPSGANRRMRSHHSSRPNVRPSPAFWSHASMAVAMLGRHDSAVGTTATADRRLNRRWTWRAWRRRPLQWSNPIVASHRHLPSVRRSSSRGVPSVRHSPSWGRRGGCATQWPAVARRRHVVFLRCQQQSIPRIPLRAVSRAVATGRLIGTMHPSPPPRTPACCGWRQQRR